MPRRSTDVSSDPARQPNRCDARRHAARVRDRSGRHPAPVHCATTATTTQALAGSQCAAPPVRLLQAVTLHTELLRYEQLSPTTKRPTRQHSSSARAAAVAERSPAVAALSAPLWQFARIPVRRYFVVGVHAQSLQGKLVATRCNSRNHL